MFNTIPASKFSTMSSSRPGSLARRERHQWTPLHLVVACCLVQRFSAFNSLNFRWTTLLADSSDSNNGNGNKNNNNKNDQVDENDYWYQGVNPVVRCFGSPIRSCRTCCHHELFARSLPNPLFIPSCSPRPPRRYQCTGSSRRMMKEREHGHPVSARHLSIRTTSTPTTCYPTAMHSILRAAAATATTTTIATTITGRTGKAAPTAWGAPHRASLPTLSIR